MVVYTWGDCFSHSVLTNLWSVEGRQRDVCEGEGIMMTDNTQDDVVITMVTFPVVVMMVVTVTSNGCNCSSNSGGCCYGGSDGDGDGGGGGGDMEMKVWVPTCHSPHHYPNQEPST